jgi:phosphoribosylaminoimidazole-succinocarboxamide synthase
MITTDRISAFDVIMQEAIPEKGMVLNQMSNFGLLIWLMSSPII